MKYNTSFKLKCIALRKVGNLSLREAASKQHIPKQTLARWLRLYNKFGKIGLENRKPGAKERRIDSEYEEIVLALWEKRQRSVYQMRRDMKKEFRKELSERQIKKIYKKYNLKNVTKKIQM